QTPCRAPPDPSGRRRSGRPCGAAPPGRRPAALAWTGRGDAMSTVFRPVGPQPARVYWVRRLVVAIVVAALVVVVWSVLRPGGADDADAAGQDAGQQAGGDSDAGTDAQAADGEAAAEGASLACTGASLTVALTATERTYAA